MVYHGLCTNCAAAQRLAGDCAGAVAIGGEKGDRRGDLVTVQGELDS